MEKQQDVEVVSNMPDAPIRIGEHHLRPLVIDSPLELPDSFVPTFPHYSAYFGDIVNTQYGQEHCSALNTSTAA
uniref:Uncharacterized protein n=1 Tax=Ascaris lumbricoides TaxID=6252 RepID=A0A0M3IP74_ASCLU